MEVSFTNTKIHLECSTRCFGNGWGEEFECEAGMAFCDSNGAGGSLFVPGVEISPCTYSVEDCDMFPEDCCYAEDCLASCPKIPKMLNTDLG